MHPRGLEDFGISLVFILYLTKLSLLFHNINAPNAFASSPSLVDTVVRRHIFGLSSTSVGVNEGEIRKGKRTAVQ